MYDYNIRISVANLGKKILIRSNNLEELVVALNSALLSLEKTILCLDPNFDLNKGISVHLEGHSLGAWDLWSLDADKIKSALSKLPANVRSINFADNRFSKVEAEGIKKALSGLSDSITSVSFAGTNIDKLGAEGIKTALSGLPKNVTFVDLSCNDLKISDLEALADFIKGTKICCLKIDSCFNLPNVPDNSTNCHSSKSSSSNNSLSSSSSLNSVTQIPANTSNSTSSSSEDKTVPIKLLQALAHNLAKNRTEEDKLQSPKKLATAETYSNFFINKGKSKEISPSLLNDDCKSLVSKVSKTIILFHEPGFDIDFSEKSACFSNR